MSVKQASTAGTRRLVATALLAMAAGACSANPETAPDAGAVQDRFEQREMKRPLPERAELPVPRGVEALPPEAILARLLADASEHSGLQTDALVVESSVETIWSDGSLGCPQPGMHYTQALVPGWHVLVRAAEAVLDYRVAQHGYFVRCEPARIRLPERQKERGPSEEGPPKG